ncbi:MAG TPA: sugar ABC transporter substrate-binding protein [Lacisediminihabitans sp.]|uniref:ABC transporter substrate-binding protein n=1 Tax=Lacisediminihabitans sp. TaxID=2787631 RepID=UPI002ED97F64
MRKRSLMGFAAVAVLAVALSGCAAGDGASASDKTVSLKIWGWTAKTQQVVDTWNKTHPSVQVKYTDAGGGNDSAAKLRTATRAGNAPDIALVEYQTLPSLVTAGVASDITKYTKGIQDKFTEGTWAQTTFDGKVYGIPQDVGPMAFTYRQDLFQKYGFGAPKTWDEFASDARVIHEADPGAYIASMPPTEFGSWAGLATQAGATWWSVKDGKWTVGIADEASLKVADFFQKLSDDGVILTEPLLTPQYDKSLNDGKILSWPSAVWAPGVLASVTPGTAGKWAMAPLPAWKAGETTVPFQGGSALVVTKNSKHPQQAAEFAAWYNASKAGLEGMINKQALYPAAIAGQKLASSQKPPALMPQQTDFYKLAATISKTAKPITWGPDVDVASTTFTDRLSKAINNHTAWRDAFTATQKAVVADMKKNGFKVTNK